ncbi:MAG: fibronectin type III domain-containing protein, partial [Armatimonadetes bacterium]|nr:fibronectin type III domain-containing protein [Armatimonadota bacterium]
AAGASQILSFGWDTAGANAGNHTLTASVGAITGESEVQAANNSGSTISTVEIPAPAAPSHLSTAATSRFGEIHLTWSDNSGNETEFVLQRATNSGFTSNLTEILLPANSDGTASYTDSGLKRKTQYYYRVRAVNSAGSSAYSNTATAKTR